MAIILTPEVLAKRRVENAKGIKSGYYFGKIDKEGADIWNPLNNAPVTNNKGVPMESFVVPGSSNWEGTKAYADCWNKIEDASRKVKAWLQRIGGNPVAINQFPDDYYTLIDQIRIDITRRLMQHMDFTSEIANEIVRADLTRTFKLDEFLPFTGVFKEIKGTGDSVPLIQQKTGDTGNVDLHIYGIGHSRSLEDEIYNTSIYSLQKVNEAVARAYVALRNTFNGIGDMIAYTLAGAWPLAQRVASSQILDMNGNVLYDQSVYYTLRNALRKLLALTDPQTGQEITPGKVVLLARNNNVVADINRIIGGQLSPGTQNGSTVRLSALGIDEVWQYKGDDIYVGPHDFNFPGVPEGHAYLFAVGPSAPNYVFVKRGLTQEVGRGDVLSLAREARAWYTVQGNYNTEWFGEVAGLGAGTGFIVDIELPEFDENT